MTHQRHTRQLRLPEQGGPIRGQVAIESGEVPGAFELAVVPQLYRMVWQKTGVAAEGRVHENAQLQPAGRQIRIAVEVDARNGKPGKAIDHRETAYVHVVHGPSR